MACTINSTAERVLEKNLAVQDFLSLHDGFSFNTNLAGCRILVGVWVCWQEHLIIVWMQRTSDTHKKRNGMGRFSCGTAVLRCYPKGTRRFTGAEPLDQ